VPDARLDGVPGTVVTPNRLLGPFETPAAALRFAVYTPFDLVCVRSGWYGTGLEVMLDGGERLLAPFDGLRVRTRDRWQLRVRAGRKSDLSDEPALLSFLRWWEMPIVQGNRMYVSGPVNRPGAGYREAGDAALVLRGGTLEPASAA
jgi:hypothetical protein